MKVCGIHLRASGQAIILYDELEDYTFKIYWHISQLSNNGHSHFNTMTPEQKDQSFADYIFTCLSLNMNDKF